MWNKCGCKNHGPELTESFWRIVFLKGEIEKIFKYLLIKVAHN